MFDNRSKYGQNAGPQWIKIPISISQFKDWYRSWGQPMPPLPLYMVNGGSCAILITVGCILLARRWGESFVVRSMVDMGKLALTFYVAHVVIGMGLIEIFSGVSLGGATAAFSVGYALLFSFGCWLFAVVWKRYFRAGPLEWVMRSVTE